MKGIGASPGLAIGTAYILEQREISFEESQFTNFENEKALYTSAVSRAIKEIDSLKTKALEEIGDEEAQIFDAHLALVNDPEMQEQIIGNIRSGESALNAVRSVTEGFIEMFEGLDDDYFKERAADIRDIRNRLYNGVLGWESRSLGNLPPDAIVIANDLTPSDTADMDKENVAGFITEVGGATSHTAIIARNLGIPAVMGVQSITEQVDNGITVVVDGTDGQVYFPIDEMELKVFEDRYDEQKRVRETLESVRYLDAVTTEGHQVEVFANIGNTEEARIAGESGAEGVGLFRTEFLYMDSKQLPCEMEQFEKYRLALEHMGEKPIIFRTLDIGGDKEIDYFDLPKEANPFLGWRAIRICFDREDIFMAQLRAILRASHYGEARIMFPMVSSVEDVKRARTFLQKAKEELKLEGVPFDENIKMGIMVEIPSAAVIADKLAAHVDFFSIGTNDLTQYTLACDRINENVRSYYNSFQPGVIHLIDNVIKAGKKTGKLVGMCGEFAGNPLAVLLLLGLGLEEFSMSPSAIPKAKQIIRSVKFEEAKNIAEQVLLMEEASEIEEFLTGALKDLKLEYLLSI